MKLVVCLAGKTERGAVGDLVDDYRKRISRYVPVEIIEAKKLRAQSREGVHVLLSPDGRHMTSEEFASFLEKILNSSAKHLFFYVGGPSGFDRELVQAVPDRISLSPMTFSHQIVRVMLFEQVYRAFTILNNEPYHK
ncbi:MAG: Ribosomal RNA large subunit methyltransferase H [Deltaproteobacteria bacterium ADurb.BinA179]|nr:23S rRNA (pseudouridine(1915)-N(3))-methyltransferase RlmH [Deltaproteobacteria bacterium]MDI9542309.1 23S rRNA (pseudouridine(1915)-N(3))-methyltransferase RlmH [Pseudomonadota bacterium]OPZ30270.1 MAG: Ribosomal RNA large subunit methyltransferase H [Deltaproteobacteria bacterium ADurb.BinA179]HOD69874.1 23S rRNA (pseudouridine(1915)-N(3))-methyltransferase RlmH [Deltaproteobacteria bacterium]HOE72897.1 23S rRNA (pseudouridine(1915)-N(3))-methyltransferase RlmH [Deltaproteobacteria bacteri